MQQNVKTDHQLNFATSNLKEFVITNDENRSDTMNMKMNMTQTETNKSKNITIVSINQLDVGNTKTQAQLQKNTERLSNKDKKLMKNNTIVGSYSKKNKKKSLDVDYETVTFSNRTVSLPPQKLRISDGDTKSLDNLMSPKTPKRERHQSDFKDKQMAQSLNSRTPSIDLENYQEHHGIGNLRERSSRIKELINRSTEDFKNLVNNSLKLRDDPPIIASGSDLDSSSSSVDGLSQKNQNYNHPPTYNHSRKNSGNNNLDPFNKLIIDFNDQNDVKSSTLGDFQSGNGTTVITKDSQDFQVRGPFDDETIKDTEVCSRNFQLKTSSHSIKNWCWVLNTLNTFYSRYL